MPITKPRALDSMVCLTMLIGCCAGCEDRKSAPAASTSSTPSATPSPPTPRKLAEKIDWHVPKLPKAELTWHVVTHSAAAITLEPLENAAIARPFEFDGISLDSLLIQNGTVRVLDGLFNGVEVPKEETAGPIEGAWPEPLLLTVTRTGYRGSIRAGAVLSHKDKAWAPALGGLSDRPAFLFFPPRNGQRQYVTPDQGGYSVWNYPSGARAELQVKPTIDGSRFRMEGGAVLGGELLVVGIAEQPEPEDFGRGGGGPPDGPFVAQRFGADGKEPTLDRLPQPAAGKLQISGVVLAGSHVWVALHQRRRAHYLAGYDGKSWSVEPIPIPASCSSTYIFAGAPDGSLFVAPTDCQLAEGDMLRRDPKGEFTSVSFPEDAMNCEVWAQRAEEVWMGCGSEKGDGGALYFTKAGPKHRALRAKPKEAD